MGILLINSARFRSDRSRSILDFADNIDLSLGTFTSLEVYFVLGCGWSRPIADFHAQCFGWLKTVPNGHSETKFILLGHVGSSSHAQHNIRFGCEISQYLVEALVDPFAQFFGRGLQYRYRCFPHFTFETCVQSRDREGTAKLSVAREDR